MPITKMCEVLRCFHVRRSTSFSNPSGFAFWCMYFEFTDECFLRASIGYWCLPFVLVLPDCFLLPLGTSDTVVEEWLYHYCTVLKTCFNNVFVSVSGVLTYVVFHNDCVPTVQLAKRCCGAITSNSPKEFLTRFHFWLVLLFLLRFLHTVLCQLGYYSDDRWGKVVILLYSTEGLLEQCLCCSQWLVVEPCFKSALCVSFYVRGSSWKEGLPCLLLQSGICNYFFFD